MSSVAQLEANRRNAQKSTGPKTPEGKARVAANAVTHGILCQKAFIDGEDAGLFTEHCLAMRESFAPVGPVEEMLADRVAAQSWRLRRATGIEGLFLHRCLGQHGLLEDEFANGAARRAELEAKIAGRQLPPQDEELRKRRGKAVYGFFFEGGVRNLDVLRRYERSIDLALHQAMRDLFTIQDARRKAAPPELPRGKDLVDAIERDPEASRLLGQFVRDAYEQARRAAMAELEADRVREAIRTAGVNSAGAHGAAADSSSGQTTSARSPAGTRGLRQESPKTTGPAPARAPAPATSCGAQVTHSQAVTEANRPGEAACETKPISPAAAAPAQPGRAAKTAAKEREEALAAAAAGA